MMDVRQEKKLREDFIGSEGKQMCEKQCQRLRLVAPKTALLVEDFERSAA